LLVERFDGSAWTRQSVARIRNVNYFSGPAVSCASTTRCELVGGYTPMRSAELHMFAERLGGSSWVRQSTPGASLGAGPQLLGVSCYTTNRCEAVGSGIPKSGNDYGWVEQYHG
jgi:hypothetical protein